MTEEAPKGSGDNPDVGPITDTPGGGEPHKTEQHPQGIESTASTADAGGKAHTSSTEGHPAGTGERSAREVGGPVAAEDAEPTTGGAKGDIQTKGFDAHQ
jgi:hypothetical protein